RRPSLRRVTFTRGSLTPRPLVSGSVSTPVEEDTSGDAADVVGRIEPGILAPRLEHPDAQADHHPPEAVTPLGTPFHRGRGVHPLTQWPLGETVARPEESDSGGDACAEVPSLLPVTLVGDPAVDVPLVD